MLVPPPGGGGCLSVGFLFSVAACAVPQDVVSKAHKACKAVLRRKRASAYLHEKIKAAVADRRLPRLRNLRLARRTRFNSYVMVLESFVLNASLVAEVIKEHSFQECFKASGDGECGPQLERSARIAPAWLFGCLLKLGGRGAAVRRGHPMGLRGTAGRLRCGVLGQPWSIY